MDKHKRKSEKRIVMHVDMDHFFTAIEEREHPEYKGQPVVVGADPKDGKGRGVVSTCNYEARRFGIKSGMPISKAWKRCRTAVFLPVNYKLYGKVASEIMSVLRRFADESEQFGIDEAFLDVSSRAGDFEAAGRLAQQIKKVIFDKEKLTCSIGIAPNKLVAKIASDFEKPDGLTLVEDKDVESFLSRLPVSKLWGIGKKTERRLNEMGIKTIGDLAAYDMSILAEKFGALGAHFSQMAQGIDRSPVQAGWEAKSMSRDVTFEEDTSDQKLVLETLDGLCEELCKEVRESNLFFRTITVKIRYKNFETHTHSKTLPFLTNRLMDLQKAVRELAQSFLQPERKIRLVGAKVSRFVSGEKQKTLICS